MGRFGGLGTVNSAKTTAGNLTIDRQGWFLRRKVVSGWLYPGSLLALFQIFGNSRLTRVSDSEERMRPINPTFLPGNPYLFPSPSPSPSPLSLTMRCSWRPVSALLRPALLPRSALGVLVHRRALSFSQVLAQEPPTGPPEHIRPHPTIRPRLSLPLGADRSFENHKHEVTVEIDGEQHSFDALFLRDLCPCPKCLDPSTKQKLFNTTDIPDDIVADSLRIKPKGQLEVIWSDPEDRPHVSFYEPEVLLQYSSPERKRHFRNPAGRQVYWDGDMMRENILRVDYKSFLESEEVLHQMLVQLHRFGLGYFVNVPSENTDGTEIARIAERFGDIKRTFYGKTWDVKSVPQSKNIAYVQPSPTCGPADNPQSPQLLTLAGA